MTNRWRDNEHKELAEQLRVHAEHLSKQDGRSSTDCTVEALKEAAIRLEHLNIIEKQYTQMVKQKVSENQNE